jgi:hypothetical protein
VGAGTLIDTVDGPGVPSRATLDLNATVNADPAHAVTVTARLYGPAEVKAIDQSQVIRTEPAGGATDFESNLFCAIELKAAELPWMFTPARPNAQDQLRPWLVLVVVEADGSTLDKSGATPLPMLSTNPSTQLPDLAQSWAWAHVQLTGPGDATTLLTAPDRKGTLGRLLSPRRLAPQTSYLAAVVPAFIQGVQTGLGQKVDPGDLRPAWLPTDTAVQLPVYYSWEFATGPEGDFETLVSRLRMHPVTSSDLDGLRLAIPDQPAGLTGVDPVRVPGALGVGAATGDPVDPTFASRLVSLLDLSPGPVDPNLPIAPPAYGRWHAGRRAASDLAGGGWLAGLNGQPAARVVAGLGTRVIQERQDQLMASAWSQIGPIARTNRLLRHGQLARDASYGLWRRHAVGLPDAALLAVTAPGGSRLLAADGRTLAAHVTASRVPDALLTVAGRRAVRPRGPIARGRAVSVAGLMQRANTRDGSAGGLAPVGVPPVRPPGMVAVDDIRTEIDRARLCDLTPQWWARLPPVPDPLVQLMRRALARHLTQFGPCAPRPPAPALPIADLANAARRGLDPRSSVTTATLARLTMPAGWAPPDPLEPVMAAPVFPTPMYSAVADLAPNLLLPGVGDLPPNSVALVGTNPWFVQAFLAGLNHEMGRELLWRGFPTDQRGTYFHRFWDRSAAVPPATGDALDDIKDMASWDPAQPLGTAGTPDSAPTADSQLVLVIRGDLLRRYPRAVIHLARATWTGQQDANGDPVPGLAAGGEERHPSFGGLLAPDVTFLGFDLPPGQARGTAADPGWYVVFAEPPVETRFGLDEQAPTEPTGTWRDLSWDTVSTDGAGYVRLTATDPITVDPTADARNLHFTTAASSAHTAAIAEHRRYRVAIHARRLLPETT